MALRLAALAVAWLVAEAQMNCTPPASSFESSLKVAFQPTFDTDICALQKPALKSGKMAELCNAFCATAGRTTGLPLLLGSETYGFNQEEMDSLCTDVSHRNASLEAFCLSRSNSLDEIMVKAAVFVARVDIFKSEQLAFRANMQNASAKLEAELASQTFANLIARSTNKLDLLKQKFSEFAATTAMQSGRTSALMTAMDQTQESSEALITSVNMNLALFEEFVNACNRMLLGTGHQNEYLLDICAQSSVACLEESAAGHVGCCCGYNPVVADSFKVDGLTASILKGGRVAAGRRLQAEDVMDLDICAEARASSKEAVAGVAARVAELGQQALLDERQQMLASKYPEYYGKCVGRRMQEALGAEAAPSLLSEPAGQPARQLQAGLSCTPPAHANTSLKVAFSNTLEADICSLQVPPVKSADMRAQCSDFCGRRGVSLLIGAETYGFELGASESICLPPEGVLIHDPAKLRDCGQWSVAFREVEVKTSQFIAQLDIFRATQQYYVATLRNVTAGIQAFVSSQEFAAKIQRARSKVEEVKAAVKERLQIGFALLVESELMAAIQALRQKAAALQAALGQNIPLIKRFLSECNDMHVGTGPQNEYLLDICAQQSVACLDEADAGHVTCCCAYHPFSTFGETVSEIIDGIQDFPNPARVRSGRRLAGGESLDICAQAWTEAAPAVAQLYAKIGATGQPAAAEEWVQKMQDQYGSTFCSLATPPSLAAPCCWATAAAGAPLLPFGLLLALFLAA
ncbi:unnamed protein product [Effrenium voratum]|uniref:Uncharacterized protein n=1 Tax=Effrenium voratum TaxID=2562239 RepID=A0AA36IKI7_9DINO|nr:unnamed protein product [Effrenium voratum]CAJ1430844.1 unnamed protein product [Effrenium voratum]